ncbi:hypothetical protein SESBI_48331 [Sesbania bispinosa]|nr:hypothetical protein SESBI_48331 [Sesbania bispinosa]
MEKLIDSHGWLEKHPSGNDIRFVPIHMSSNNRKGIEQGREGFLVRETEKGWVVT